MKIKYYSLLDFVLELCSKASSIYINKQLSTFNNDAPKLNFWTILFPKWSPWVRNSLLVQYQPFTKVRFYMWNQFMSSICSYQPVKIQFYISHENSLLAIKYRAVTANIGLCILIYTHGPECFFDWSNKTINIHKQ